MRVRLGRFAVVIMMAAVATSIAAACGDTRENAPIASSDDASAVEEGGMDAVAADANSGDVSSNDANARDEAADGGAATDATDSAADAVGTADACAPTAYHYVDVVHGYSNDTCALDDQGAVRCLGAGWVEDPQSHVVSMKQNAYAVPTTMPGLGADVVELRMGAQFVCALESNGAVLCWGANDKGQLGDASFTGAARATPTAVVGLGTATHLAIGSTHACALLDTGHVKCWGDNNLGLLGNASITASSHSATPVEVDGVTGGVQIDASMFISCARVGSGALKCWGWPPTLPAAGVDANIADFAVATYGGCARTTANALKCWGEARAGTYQAATIYDAQDVPGLTGQFKAFALRDYGACVIMNAGGVKCWGQFVGGRTPATGYLTTPSTPLDVAALGTDVTALRLESSTFFSYDQATHQFLAVSTDSTGHTENKSAFNVSFGSTACGAAHTASGFHAWSRRARTRAIADENDTLATTP